MRVLAVLLHARYSVASAPGLYVACAALSAACAATRKRLVSTVRACVKNNWGERSEAPHGRYISDFPYIIGASAAKLHMDDTSGIFHI